MLLVRDDLYVRHINRVMVAIDGTGVGDDALKLAVNSCAMYSAAR